MGECLVDFYVFFLQKVNFGEFNLQSPNLVRVLDLVWTLFYFSQFCACVSGWRKMHNDPDTDEYNLGLGAGSAKAIISEFLII